jgi:hypothetical protein
MGWLSGSKEAVDAVGDASGDFILCLIFAYCLDQAALPCGQLAMLKGFGRLQGFSGVYRAFMASRFSFRFRVGCAEPSACMRRRRCRFVHFACNLDALLASYMPEPPTPDPKPKRLISNGLPLPYRPLLPAKCSGSQRLPDADIWFYMGWRKVSCTLHAICMDRRGPGAPMPKPTGESHWNAQPPAKSPLLKSAGPGNGSM